MEENATEVKDKDLVLSRRAMKYLNRMKVKMLYKIIPNRNNFVLM